MSSFTRPLVIQAVPSVRTGWKRLLPPGMQRPKWCIWIGFIYAVGDLDKPSERIHVEADFEFDGASVPLLLRLIVPMAHPDYIQATALHDFMLTRPYYRRGYCDRVFLEALGVLGMPRFWRMLMFSGVQLATARATLCRYLPKFRKDNQ